MSRPVDNNKNQPLDLASFAETHQVNVSVVPVESPADARVRRGKDIALFTVALRSAAALSKHLALPCAKCLRARGVFLAPTALGLGDTTMTLRWVPTQLSGASRHRFALLGSAAGFPLSRE